MPRRLNSADAFTHLVFALEVMKEASSAVNAPVLSPVLALILSIVKTIETFRKDKQGCIRLAKRAFELAERVYDTIRAEANAIDHELTIELRNLYGIVAHIQADLDKWTHQRKWALFLRRGTLSDMLDEHFDAIDGAWRSFTAVSLVVKGSGCIAHDEWEGEYNGSDVSIRKYADEAYYEQSLFDSFRCSRICKIYIPAATAIPHCNFTDPLYPRFLCGLLLHLPLPDCRQLHGITGTTAGPGTFACWDFLFLPLRARWASPYASLSFLLAPLFIPWRSESRIYQSREFCVMVSALSNAIAASPISFVSSAFVCENSVPCSVSVHNQAALLQSCGPPVLCFPGSWYTSSAPLTAIPCEYSDVVLGADTLVAFGTGMTITSLLYLAEFTLLRDESPCGHCATYGHIAGQQRGSRREFGLYDLRALLAKVEDPSTKAVSWRIMSS